MTKLERLREAAKEAVYCYYQRFDRDGDALFGPIDPAMVELKRAFNAMWEEDWKPTNKNPGG